MAYVNISELTHNQQISIQQSAWELASNVELPTPDYDNIIRSGISNWLVSSADEWASFDEEDSEDDSYQQVIRAYFGSGAYFEDLLAVVRARKEDENLEID